VSFEDFSKFIDSEIKRVSSFASVEDMGKSTSVSTELQKQLLKINGVDITRGNTNDSYALGNILFDIDKTHPFDISFGENVNVAEYFYKAVLMKILSNKAMNPENIIEELANNYAEGI